MSNPTNFPRRDFLKRTAALSASAFVLPRIAIGQSGPSANGKVNIAMIGAGGIASQAYDGSKGENIVALCDVDSKTLDAARAKQAPKAKTFTDFREMFDKMGDEIDMVCVNTPDHTHFPATMEAMQRGIHVFTQKPLVHNVWEGRTLAKAKEKYKVHTNMGNQGHTFDGIRQMREWYEAGIFGQIKEAHSWINGPDWGGRYFARPEDPMKQHAVPENLDYDLWLGPCPETPYHRLYHPRRWRGFNKFGTGTLGDWFCHVADAPVWVLDLYDPVSVEAVEVDGGSDLLVPDGATVRWDFEKRGTREPLSFYWHNGTTSLMPKKPEGWTISNNLPKYGTLYFGDKQIGYTDERSNNPRLGNREAMLALKKAGFPEEKYPRVKGGPIRELVDVVKGNIKEAGANFDYSVPMNEVMLLGVLACRHGGKIDWDAKNMKITNRPELNQFLKDPVRKGWEYGEDLWT
ncbi:Gfo/Idh/MocA family protein [Haloferula chungangensis]|uniref:Gfo/Idh/MocA family protein n=1 Tax=Haloferula chungangensis TaxID=1048331 RepID=A0ABW2L8G6_9BACT